MSQLDDLRQRCERQRSQLAELNEVLARKNRELDALHMVWCDGGCLGGVHRYQEAPVTEETVLAAELNTERLRRWFDSVRFRLGYYPTASDWHREQAVKLAEKIAEPDLALPGQQRSS